MTIDDAENKDRDSLGRFQKGKATGRPLGSKNHSVSITRLKKMEEQALAKLYACVLNGDMKAIQYVLDKILPKDRTIEFHGLETEDLKEALVTGQLSIAEGKELSVTLKNLEELESLNEVRKRLADLEANHEL